MYGTLVCGIHLKLNFEAKKKKSFVSELFTLGNSALPLRLGCVRELSSGIETRGGPGPLSGYELNSTPVVTLRSGPTDGESSIDSSLTLNHFLNSC